MTVTDKTKSFPTVDAQTFASVMGQAVWLMTMSKDHRDLPIRTVEDLLSPAILLKQFKLYSQGKQPLAFLIWASVSDEVKARVDSGNKQLELADWRSGTNIIVVDCISPLHSAEPFIEKFMASATEAQARV
ncbi:toxin-activating lysine-acyltransferase [Phaeobacter inhibens]|uniref:toxin-activating lysine-acyltransferase n=1 Tax=Phaeobacter inhibens TaxID=221822 RepID=UPI000CA36A9A|nr:toxin-activating lysine-acyltransferase [Phaeobacter inhibens]AUQ66365.1 cyclolysin-activating lysine-acyltransferase CyaC [Phaeobacter inhibens]